MDQVTAGILAVIVGFAVVLVSMLGGQGEGKTDVKGGAVLMIGPVPIIFGSDARWASIAIVLAIVLVVVYFLLWVV